MAEISQRRDLESDEEILAFAQLAGDVETLDMLMLLTFCDSMGTSTDLWTGFKDSLIWTLYDRTRQSLQGVLQPKPALDEAKKTLYPQLREKVRKSIPDDEIQAHLQHMPDRYFRNRPLDQMVEDIHLTHRFMWRQISKQDRALEPIVHWRHDRDRGFSALDLVTWDRPAIFCKFAGALAAAGLTILSARIFTRSDGIVLDSFELVDASSGELVKKFKRDKFSAMIKAVLGEGADLDTLVDKNSKTPPLYQTVERDSLEGQVRFDNDRLPSVLLEVETEDRVGLLYKVSKVLHEQQLTLYSKSLPRGAAIDSFYIKNHRAEISAPSEQRRIKTALLKALKKDPISGPVLKTPLLRAWILGGLILFMDQWTKAGGCIELGQQREWVEVFVLSTGVTLVRLGIYRGNNYLLAGVAMVALLLLHGVRNQFDVHLLKGRWPSISCSAVLSAWWIDSGMGMLSISSIFSLSPRGRRWVSCLQPR